MRKALYCGSFNPVHRGHMQLASYVVEHCPDIDEVVLSVTPCNPLRTLPEGATDDQRIALAFIAAAELEGVSANAIEFALPAPHYTYLTLQALQKVYPDDTFTLMIGADNWVIFQKWSSWQDIIDEFGILIYPRPGYEIDPATLPEGVKYLADAPQLDISSTQIREALSQGRDASEWLSPAVNWYINYYHIYQS